MTLTRKEFLKTSVALAAAGLMPAACGDDTETGDSGSPSSGAGATGTSSTSASSTSGSTSSTTGPGSGGAGATGGMGGTGPGSGGTGGGTGGAGGDAGGSSAGDCKANGTNVMIGANHGHMLVVSKDDVIAGVDKTYTGPEFMGTALHTHTVTVTGADFAMLQSNQSIMVTSSTAAMHSHPITVTCA